MAKEQLPDGYRIDTYIIRRGDADDPYDAGVWAYKLEVWEAREVGHLWWKHRERGWWVVDRSNSPVALTQTAWLHNRDRTMT